jgi:hypothetical protein
LDRNGTKVACDRVDEEIADVFGLPLSANLIDHDDACT